MARESLSAETGVRPAQDRSGSGASCWKRYTAGLFTTSTITLLRIFFTGLLLIGSAFSGEEIDAKPVSEKNGIAQTTDTQRSDEQVIEVQSWARATPPGASTGAIYGEFTNLSDKPMSVSRIEFQLAHHVMVHRTSHDKGMARMQEGQLTLAPGETVTMKPGGLHIMLMGLSGGLSEGCEYAYRLIWADDSVTSHRFKTGKFGQMSAPEADLSCLSEDL